MSKTVSSPILDTCYMNPEAFPWIPWIEGTEIKVLKANPINGQFFTLLKASKGAVIPPHYHHGTVTVYTVQGAWNYEGEEWVAKAGDVIFEPAGSLHQPLMHSEEDVITLNIIDGVLEFQDTEGNPLFMLNWSSALDMYKEYCDVHGVDYIDVTRF
ncbi:quercetin dioxygenase-like cupin family protein [Cytobacillus firmus]|uniref:Quercetin dioxygenase-like cupin family protein n=2 Tax=Cytobacillus TaxID=2675230 RepID=A0A366K240_CYTFI|nr:MULTISPECIES: 2,4'-dihydroxyacetophenone dioxygenase family protein [Cytobacillus]RBP95839.1 quercetin dioxygenase-like cupin family protein [Cytobacillus firmus]TDX44752.1 quercetin dioxygenase-like cupin family protein [Cytobacillus oceanisediminis]